MSEVQNINNLIQVGMTKNDFITKYKQMLEDIKNEPAKSIFAGNLSDDAISRMFDSITIANDDGDDCENAQISQADYDKIAGYDGDTSSISDEDLVKYYEDMLQNTPMVSGPVDSDTPSMTYAQGLDILSDLKGLKTQSAENRKNDLQNEIDELIEKDSSISAETKQKYKDMQKALKELKSGLEERKRQLETNKRNTQILEAKIASKRAKADNIEDENDKANLEEEITSLNEDMSAFETDAKNLQTDITHFKSDITRLTKDLEKIMKEIEKSSAETARKIAEKQAEMDRVDQELAQDIANIDEQMEKAQKQLILEAQRAGTDSANYANAGNDGHIGKTASQALSNAAGEIGVREATGRNDGAAVAKYRGGVDNGAAWCASFVSWCYKGNDVFGYQASVSGIQMAAQRQGLYSEKGTYTPKPGDVMIQKNGCSHTGIVESVDPDGTIHTIEGNASNQVKRVTYRPGSKGYNHISGFVRMSERG